MDTYILAHDLGTSGNKASLFQTDGSLIANTSYSYPTYYLSPGWAEQNPEDYWLAFCECTKKILKKARIKPKQIGAVSFSGQMMAALPVDSRGRGIRKSIIWADLRSTTEADLLRERIGEERFYEISGNRLSASYPVAKIMWVKKNEPDVYRNTWKFINAKDFVAARLTGNIVSDYSDASAMALLDIRSLEWSGEIIQASGIDPDKLPPLVESTSVIGEVRREVADECGLAPGTPVVKGAGDGPCATTGSGVVDEGEAYMYIGTSTWMGLATRRPYIDPKRRTHTFCHFVRGLYAPAGTMQSGGGSLGWLENNLCPLESYAAVEAQVDVYDILSIRASAIPSGSGNLIFLPYLMGERCPLWNPDARGCFIGLSLIHTKDHLIRAVLEGVAYHMKMISEAFSEQGARFEVIRLIGGGAKSDVWRSILADIIGVEIVKLNYLEEATSIGAAVAGGLGTGFFSSLRDVNRFIRVVERTPPAPQNRERYLKYYRIFEECYRRLEDIFPGLGRFV